MDSRTIDWLLLPQLLLMFFVVKLVFSVRCDTHNVCLRIHLLHLILLLPLLLLPLLPFFVARRKQMRFRIVDLPQTLFSVVHHRSGSGVGRHEMSLRIFDPLQTLLLSFDFIDCIRRECSRGSFIFCLSNVLSLLLLISNLVAFFPLLFALLILRDELVVQLLLIAHLLIPLLLLADSSVVRKRGDSNISNVGLSLLLRCSTRCLAVVRDRKAAAFIDVVVVVVVHRSC